MQKVYDLIGRVARTEASILITGETGTGKEVVAATIHGLSRRSKQAFLPVNCGAVSASLIETELFGHERGSSPVPIKCTGGISSEPTGDVFLDEVSEMPIELQVKLLRVLETSVVTRVGGNGSIRVDVRIVAATSTPIEEAVAAGKLREDLLYRLNVFPIPLPPLCERGDDIELLAETFLSDLNASEGTTKQLTRESRKRLRRHSWPGNVRELRNVIERAFILSEEDVDVKSLPLPGAGRRPLQHDDAAGDLSWRDGTPPHPGDPRSGQWRQEEGRRCSPDQHEDPLQPPERIQGTPAVACVTFAVSPVLAHRLQSSKTPALARTAGDSRGG